MKTSTQDQVEGKLHKVKGGIKDIIGKLTKDHELEAEGGIEKIARRGTRKGRTN